MPQRKQKINSLVRKIVLFILAAGIFLFFSNDFGLSDIQKTAVVLAVGIDKQGDEYSVSADIALPSDQQGQGRSQDSVVSGTGKTVAQAFSQINVKTGYFPKLAFCEVIVLGEEMVKEDVLQGLGYFLRNEYMSDNCLIATCNGKAKEVLSASVPTDPVVGIGLRKILSTEAKQAGNVSCINLKDFSVGYYSEHESGYMPYLTNQTATKDGEQGKSTLRADRCALFHAGKMVGLLDEEQTFAFNLTSSPIKLATLQVTTDEKTYSLGLKDVRADTVFKVENSLPSLRVTLCAKAQTLDGTLTDEVYDVTPHLTVDAAVLQAARQQLTAKLKQAFSLGQACGCDLFTVADKLKRFEQPHHDRLKDNVLQRTSFSTEIHLTDRS